MDDNGRSVFTVSDGAQGPPEREPEEPTETPMNLPSDEPDDERIQLQSSVGEGVKQTAEASSSTTEDDLKSYTQINDDVYQQFVCEFGPHASYVPDVMLVVEFECKLRRGLIGRSSSNRSVNMVKSALLLNARTTTSKR